MTSIARSKRVTTIAVERGLLTLILCTHGPGDCEVFLVAASPLVPGLCQFTAEFAANSCELGPDGVR